MYRSLLVPLDRSPFAEQALMRAYYKYVEQFQIMCRGRPRMIVPLSVV